MSAIVQIRKLCKAAKLDAETAPFGVELRALLERADVLEDLAAFIQKTPVDLHNAIAQATDEELCAKVLETIRRYKVTPEPILSGAPPVREDNAWILDAEWLRARTKRGTSTCFLRA